jgi:hypothetical protein
MTLLTGALRDYHHANYDGTVTPLEDCLRFPPFALALTRFRPMSALQVNLQWVPPQDQNQQPTCITITPVDHWCSQVRREL